MLNIHLAAVYLSVGESTIRDYVADKILRAVELPGSTIRDQSGRVIAHAKARRIAKLLFDREDLDAFIDQMKRET